MKNKNEQKNNLEKMKQKAEEFDFFVESSKLSNYRKVFLFFRTNPSDTKNGIKHSILEKAANRAFNNMARNIFGNLVNSWKGIVKESIIAGFPRIFFQVKT